LCPDSTGEFADISCGDPWYKKPESDEPGMSLVLVRTERKGRSAIMARTGRGREVVVSAIGSGDMIADPITVKDMLGYNKHLVIGSKHARHGWMAGYQLLFLGRVKCVFSVLWALLCRKRIGLMTTLKARLSKQYYY
jgi:hypothetical protein